MKKTILALLLATTTLSFADVFKDACDDFDRQASSNKRLTILEYAEELSVRTNQARTDRNEKAADRLLKLFAVTVSTGLKFGIDKNASLTLVGRLEKAIDIAYRPLSKGVSPQDLAESLGNMDEVFETSRNRGTLDQYAAVVEYSYQAVGLDKIKPWDQIPGITALKTTPPSQIFLNLFQEGKKDEGKPKVVAVLTPKKAEPKPPTIQSVSLNVNKNDVSKPSFSATLKGPTSSEKDKKEKLEKKSENDKEYEEYLHVQNLLKVCFLSGKKYEEDYLNIYAKQQNLVKILAQNGRKFSLAPNPNEYDNSSLIKQRVYIETAVTSIYKKFADKKDQGKNVKETAKSEPFVSLFDTHPNYGRGIFG